MPLNGALYIQKAAIILIRAFKSQFNLKPDYYKESHRLSIAVSVLFLSLSFYLCTFIFKFFGIETDISLRQYDQVAVFKCLLGCLITIAFCLYIGWVFLSMLFYGNKYRKGLITKSELNDITFKGHFPMRWQKCRVTDV